jgi:hypothetical protein
MDEVIWAAVFVAVAGTGIAIALARRSRTWILAGIAFALGGIGIAGYALIPDPPLGTAVDVGGWFALVGFFSLLIATALTLVAIGSRGRRRFVVLLAATSLVVGTYLFWTSNWPARFGDVPTRCADTDHDLGPNGGVQRIPPGVRCFDGIAQTSSRPMPTEAVFVPADAICWLALLGWSVFYSFVASYPLMGMAWLFRRRPALALP